MLHFAFEGQTPDETYFGTGASIPAKLKQKREQARAAGLAHNRAVTCARCKIEDTKPAMVRFYFQLSIIHFLAAQRLAGF